MSKANAEIRTKHGVRYRHPPPKPHQKEKGKGPWYLRLSIYKGNSSTAKTVDSSKKGLSWAKKPDPEQALDEFLKLLAPTPRKKQASPSADAAGSAGESQGGRSLRSGPKQPPKGREASGKRSWQLLLLSWMQRTNWRLATAAVMKQTGRAHSSQSHRSAGSEGGGPHSAIGGRKGSTREGGGSFQSSGVRGALSR